MLESVLELHEATSELSGRSHLGVRLLIADDSIVSRHLLEAMVRKWGYDPVVAADGLEAWKILQSDNPPRIAILDWVMPGLTGPEVCKKVREKFRSDSTYIYLILLSSKGERDDLIEGMESGADDYVIKPPDQHELKVRLRSGTRIIDLQTELVAAREALRDQATRDALTRLWNRGAIIEQLQRDLARGERENTPVGIVLADLDRFKSINDTHGHLAGDAVLREFARRMTANIRTYDAIGRYGGEEFLIVLPGCDKECAIIQAERMREILAAEPMSLGDSSLLVTGSFGVTAWRPGTHPHIEHLVRTADNALYTAKRQGRNRVDFLDAEIAR